MPGNICRDSPKATSSFWVTLRQRDTNWGQGLQTCWTLAAPRHQGEGESTAGATGTAGQTSFLPHQPWQHPPGCTVSLLTPTESVPTSEPGEGKGKQCTRGESTVCSNTLPRQLSCHKGWELFGCLHSASNQPSHTSSLCARALICPFIFNNLFPRSETFNQPD